MIFQRKFPAWKSWWLHYKVKGLLYSFVSVASFALVPFTGLLVLTHFRLAISLLLELLCLTFSICLSLLPAVFRISCFHHCTKPRWLSTEYRGTHSSCPWSCAISHPAPLVAEIGGVQSHRGNMKGKRMFMVFRNIMCWPPEHPHGLCVAFPPELWQLMTLGQFHNHSKRHFLDSKKTTMSKLEVTVPEVLDFHSE